MRLNNTRKKKTSSQRFVLLCEFELLGMRTPALVVRISAGENPFVGGEERPSKVSPDLLHSILAIAVVCLDFALLEEASQVLLHIPGGPSCQNAPPTVSIPRPRVALSDPNCWHCIPMEGYGDGSRLPSRMPTHGVVREPWVLCLYHIFQNCFRTPASWQPKKPR